MNKKEYQDTTTSSGTTSGVIFKWPEPPKPGHSIVKLREGNGEPPLILLHGGGGGVHAFGPLKSKFRSALWAIQVTPDTPLDNLESQAQFYVKKIKEEQPHGPYRLASFSASSLILYAMALHFEQLGDKIIQLSLIDHFPYVYLCPVIGVDPRVDDYDNPRTRRLFHQVSIDNLVAMTRRDGGGGVPKRMQLAKELELAFNGLPTTEFSNLFWQVLEAFLNGNMDHIRSLPDRMAQHQALITTELKSKGEVIAEALIVWLRQVKVTPTVYVAAYGMYGSLTPKQREDWWHLGARTVFPDAKVVLMHAGHYDILSNDDLVAGLQEGYVPAAELSVVAKL
jgi:pimeloyl-ACP methyl ester carboxylesterase